MLYNLPSHPCARVHACQGHSFYIFKVQNGHYRNSYFVFFFIFRNVQTGCAPTVVKYGPSSFKEQSSK